MTAKIPVLMYHALEDAEHPSGAKDPGEQLYVLQVRQFREQMEYLQQEGFKSFLLEELTYMPNWPEKAVVITFDDGHESNLTLALPILQEFGFNAEFFITTGWIGTRHYMTTQQIKDLHTAGMEIGSHGKTHAFFSDLCTKLITDELESSKDCLSNIICTTVTSLSAPGGRINNKVRDIAISSGYKTIYTSCIGFLRPPISNHSISRCAIKKNLSMDDYSRMVECNYWYYFKNRCKNYILKVLKFILTNKGYMKLHCCYGKIISS